MSLIPFAPFNLILVLFSFVYAAAVTHVLSTAGEIIIASKRIRLSWFNAGWMLGFDKSLAEPAIKKKNSKLPGWSRIIWMKGSD